MYEVKVRLVFRGNVNIFDVERYIFNVIINIFNNNLIVNTVISIIG